jgi:hypothetical protein
LGAVNAGTVVRRCAQISHREDPTERVAYVLRNVPITSRAELVVMVVPPKPD